MNKFDKEALILVDRLGNFLARLEIQPHAAAFEEALVNAGFDYDEITIIMRFREEWINRPD